MSIWDDPKLTFTEFGEWVTQLKLTTKKDLFSKYCDNNKELTLNSLEKIIYDLIIKKLTLNNNTKVNVKKNELIKSINMIFDWIIENKFNYNQKTLNNNDFMVSFFIWINESCQPLNDYIDNENDVTNILNSKHKPTESQLLVVNQNKKLLNKHPSLAHMFFAKPVNNGTNNEEIKPNVDKLNYEYYQKNINWYKKHSKIRKSRANLFFNHSKFGYEIIANNIWLFSDDKLKNKEIKLTKGELIGGEPLNNNSNIIKIIEPLKGYIKAEWVKEFKLDDVKWKFKVDQKKSSLSIQFMDLEPANLGITGNFDGDSDEEMKSVRFNIKSDIKSTKSKDSLSHLPNASMIVNVASSEYNEFPDEKEDEKQETLNESESKQFFNNIPTRDNGNGSNDRAMELKQYKIKAKKIMSLKAKNRTPKQVLQLWNYAFNLHDLDILRECYSKHVVSQQLVNHELNGIDPIIQCFSNLFHSSDDVGMEITNIIVKDNSVVLNWKWWGDKISSDNGSTNSPSNNNQNSDEMKDNNSNSTKNGYKLPKKIINGVGLFDVNNGKIITQKLYWDQDQQWFSDMNVIKMPESKFSALLFRGRPLPMLPNNVVDPLSINEGNNISDNNDSIDSNNNGNNGIITIGEAGDWNDDDDHAIIYEMGMNDELNKMLQIRGLSIKDLPKNDWKHWERKKKQFAQGIFWIAFGATFVYIIPKYLGNKRRC